MGGTRDRKNSATCTRPKQWRPFHGCVSGGIDRQGTCLKDLHEEHSVSAINDGDNIKSFCSKYNVGEKHVITYINHHKDIDI